MKIGNEEKTKKSRNKNIMRRQTWNEIRKKKDTRKLRTREKMNIWKHELNIYNQMKIRPTKTYHTVILGANRRETKNWDKK